MIGQQELLDMIATEAVEDIEKSRMEDRIPRTKSRSQNETSPSINYSLRLVYDTKGHLYWVD